MIFLRRVWRELSECQTLEQELTFPFRLEVRCSSAPREAFKVVHAPPQRLSMGA